MPSVRLTHSDAMNVNSNYECEVHSHLSCFYEPHSQLCYGCEAHSHLFYEFEAHSQIRQRCEAHSHSNYKCEAQLHLQEQD